MALGKPKRPGLCLTPVTVSRYRFTCEKVTVILQSFNFLAEKMEN